MNPPRIGFLMGRTPGAHSVLPKILDRIRAAGARTSVQVLHPGAALDPRLLTADLAVLRSLDLRGLASAHRIELACVPCCNSVDATRMARDKAACLDALERAGIPVPVSEYAEEWRDVRGGPAGGGGVVKSVYGSRGSGTLITDGDALPKDPPFAGPYLVQERIDRRGPDRKIYVVGDRMAGVLRPWPANSLSAKRGLSFTPGRLERCIAEQCGKAVGLELFGVDILQSASGFVVVDVNAFPGYKGVDGADAWLADYLLDCGRRPRQNRPHLLEAR